MPDVAKQRFVPVWPPQYPPSCRARGCMLYLAHTPQADPIYRHGDGEAVLLLHHSDLEGGLWSALLRDWVDQVHLYEDTG